MGTRLKNLLEDIVFLTVHSTENHKWHYYKTFLINRLMYYILLNTTNIWRELLW